MSSREVHLDEEHWGNVPATAGRWHDYNNAPKNNGEDDGDKIAAIMPLINLIAPHELTARQREVLALYAHGKTQVQIARYLGIRQPTVNEHLFGKKRNNRWVGHQGYETIAPQRIKGVGR